VPAAVVLQAEIPDTLPGVIVDPLQLATVFENIVENGVHAMPAGGELRIKASVPAPCRVAGPGGPAREGRGGESPPRGCGRVAISFADTGEGIAPENIRKLFAPLHTTKARGIGLGLAIAKKYVEANGGAIEVWSDPGKGTTVTVLLPCERT